MLVFISETGVKVVHQDSSFILCTFIFLILFIIYFHYYMQMK